MLDQLRDQHLVRVAGQSSPNCIIRNLVHSFYLLVKFRKKFTMKTLQTTSKTNDKIILNMFRNIFAEISTVRYLQ